MNNLIFIGTLHAGFTKNDELAEVVIKQKPDIILVEIEQSKLEENNISQYPPEMIFLAELARKISVQLFGFDSSIDVLKQGKTEADNIEIIKKQSEIISCYNWKQFNNPNICSKLDFFNNELIDIQKWDAREGELYKNISKIHKRNRNKRIVIITGCGHIKFFQNKFPKALFPLVDNK